MKNILVALLLIYSFCLKAQTPLENFLNNLSELPKHSEYTNFDRELYKNFTGFSVSLTHQSCPVVIMFILVIWRKKEAWILDQ